MSLRHVYERTFDEDVASIERSSNGWSECGGLVHTNSIETACEDCGLVLEDRPIDHGPEWRAFDETESNERKRTGPALTPTRHDHGLSSEIGFDQTDANGSTLSGRKRSQIARLRREHRRGRWFLWRKGNRRGNLRRLQEIRTGALDPADESVSKQWTWLRDSRPVCSRTAETHQILRNSTAPSARVSRYGLVPIYPPQGSETMTTR